MIYGDVLNMCTAVELYLFDWQASMKKAALEEIKRVLVEDLKGPVDYLKQLLRPYQETQDLFMQLARNVKGAWDSLATGYVCGYMCTTELSLYLSSMMYFRTFF